MNMYFIQFECVPAVGGANEKEYGGAYVNGWILSNSLVGAKEIFIKGVKKCDWTPVVLEESYEIDGCVYSDDDEELEFYNQAKIDGEAYCAHAWPNEPQEK